MPPKPAISPSVPPTKKEKKTKKTNNEIFLLVDEEEKEEEEEEEEGFIVAVFLCLRVCVVRVCVCLRARVCCACFCFAEWFKIDSWDFFFLTKDKILHNLDLKLDSMCDFRVTFCCFTKAKYQLGPLPDFL